MYNKVTIIGRLGTDPNLKYTPNGTPVAELSVATERKYRDAEGQLQKETLWIPVVLWNDLAETANAYLTKGRLVAVDGYLKCTRWEDTNGHRRERCDVVAETIVYLDTRPKGRGVEIENLPADLGVNNGH